MLARRCLLGCQLRARSCGRAASTFAALGVDARLCAALAASGISVPTQIQAEAAPLLLLRKNTLVAAETGSGKTVAYLAPLLHNMLVEVHKEGGAGQCNSQPNGPRLLVLTPNRTLCDQVETVARALMQGLPLTCSAGSSERSAPNHNGTGRTSTRRTAPDVLVSTPRALLPPGLTPPLHQLSCVVMDEGDLLLRDGYVKDVAQLLEAARVRLHSLSASV